MVSWYVLTNDFSSSRTKVVRIYYYRFEIEETFKDMKHIFELKRTRLNKPLSLKLLLWFVSIGIALLYIVTKPTKQRLVATNPKKRTSWLRQAYELLQQSTNQLLWGQGWCTEVWGGSDPNSWHINIIVYNNVSF